MTCLRSRAPSASSSAVQRRMRATGSASKSEARLRATVHRRGMRFRVAFSADPKWPRRTVDLAFTRARVCVFVDGCFWHGCPRHFICPATNGAWWREKICDTQLRDSDATARLRSLGWLVIRIWEHQLATPESTEDVADRIQRAYKKRIADGNQKRRRS